MLHFYAQLENEVTKKLLRHDFPMLAQASNEKTDSNSEINAMSARGAAAKFDQLRDFISIYEDLDLVQINQNFNAYSKKILRDVIPFSKAKFILNHMLVFQGNNEVKPMFEHSFVQGTARALNFSECQYFQWFISHCLRYYTTVPPPEERAASPEAPSPQTNEKTL